MSFLAQGVLAKDGMVEKMTLLVSVPIESPIGTFQKIPLSQNNKGSEYESHNNFSQSEK